MSGPLSPLSGPLSRLCMCVLSIFSEDQVFHPGATQEMYLQVPRLPRNFALFPPRIYHTSVQVIKCFIDTAIKTTEIPINRLIKGRRGCATSFPWSIDDRPEGDKAWQTTWSHRSPSELNETAQLRTSVRYSVSRDSATLQEFNV